MSTSTDPSTRPDPCVSGAFEVGIDASPTIEHVCDTCHARSMAGGMHGKLGPGLTLAERSQLSGLADARAGTHRRHCWVTGPDDDPGPLPGLVLDWQRQDDGTWQAWVIYLASPA